MPTILRKGLYRLYFFSHDVIEPPRQQTWTLQLRHNDLLQPTRQASDEVALRDRLSNPLIVELTAFESLRTAVG